MATAHEDIKDGRWRVLFLKDVKSLNRCAPICNSITDRFFVKTWETGQPSFFLFLLPSTRIVTEIFG
jgi:hypothetical protein